MDQHVSWDLQRSPGSDRSADEITVLFVELRAGIT